MSENAKAVFLSYASQDAEAARRICESLRAAGVEVWFDQSELVGGDAWDHKIRTQIKECALLIPIISANTQARTEGYFRLEWRLAEQRTHLMAKGRPFLLPVVIDDTRDAEAQVPDSFTEVQWTRLHPLGYGGQARQEDVHLALRKFAERVKKLLGGGSEVVTGRTRPENETPAPPKKLSRRWLAPVVAGGAVAVLALVLSRPWESRVAPLVAVSAKPSLPATELERVRARIIPERWLKEDFAAVSTTLERMSLASPEDGEVWAFRSIINSLQVIRNFDPGTKPLQQGKAAADQARRFAPESPLADLAMGLHLVAMISHGGDPEACRPFIDHAVAVLPRDGLTRFAELASYWLGYNFDGTERSAKRWLQDEPGAPYPAWILGQYYVARRDPAQAEKWAGSAIADPNITGVRARYTLFEAAYYLRADLPACRILLQQIPPAGRSVHRIVHARWLTAMAEKRWDEALQELSQLPEPILFERIFHGPRSLLAGLAHQQAGRPEAAAVQFAEAEKLLRVELATDPESEELHAVLALTLASAGRAADARSELALVEPLLRGRAPTNFRGGSILLVAQSCGVLGDFPRMVFWLRKLLTETSGTPFTPASLRLDPRFNAYLENPEMQALLREFAGLDATPLTVQVDQKSVAVLAFANLSDDKANEYFSDGISEELLNVLAKIQGLKVSARTSAFFFKGKQVPLAEIAQQLGVAYVVEGSVRKSGDRVRISAQLIKAADGFQLWSDKFDRELKDIFAVQDEIARLIAQQLQLKLGTAKPARVVDPEAHRLLLEARYYWHQRGEQNFDRTEALLNRALALDPDFAPAHAAMADMWVMRAAYRSMEGAGDLSAEFRSLKASAARAIELDPSLVSPIAAVAYGLLIEGRMEASRQQFEAAVALSPNDPTVRFWRALFLIETGDFDLAHQEFARARELDPKSWIITHLSGYNSFGLGRVDEALSLVRQANVDRTEPFAPAVAYEALALWQTGRTKEAVAVARAVRGSWPKQPRWHADAHAIWILRQAGLEQEVADYSASLLAGFASGSYQRGFVLAALGRFDEALPFLERTNTLSVDALAWMVIFDPWREDARFKSLIEKLHWTQQYSRARAAMGQRAPLAKK